MGKLLSINFCTREPGLQNWLILSGLYCTHQPCHGKAENMDINLTLNTTVHRLREAELALTPCGTGWRITFLPDPSSEQILVLQEILCKKSLSPIPFLVFWNLLLAVWNAGETGG
jgi:hypothetical protein